MKLAKAKAQQAVAQEKVAERSEIEESLGESDREKSSIDATKLIPRVPGFTWRFANACRASSSAEIAECAKVSLPKLSIISKLAINQLRRKPLASSGLSPNAGESLNESGSAIIRVA